MKKFVDSRLLNHITNDGFNTIEISSHPDLTLEVLKKFPNKAWTFYSLHRHPNFSFEWVNNFKLRFWDWNRLSMIATIDDVINYPNFFWNWSILTDNFHFTDIMKHPDLPWDFNLFHDDVITDDHIPFFDMFLNKIPDWKWARFAKHTTWKTFKKGTHLPWVYHADAVNISPEEFMPEDIQIIRDVGTDKFNWIKLTMNIHVDIINANPDLEWIPEFLQWNKTSWKVPSKSVESCIREWTAANTIKRYWREAICNPAYKVCRSRLEREFKELVSEESTMSTTTVSFCKLRPDAIIPSKATPGSIGLDLHSVEPYIILPGQRVVVSTGLQVRLPSGVYGRIAPRSGLAVKHGLDVGAGVVDPDYNGELRVVLFNHDSHNPFIIRPGYRIAQLILERAIDDVDVHEVEEVVTADTSERGTNGFGSSGL